MPDGYATANGMLAACVGHIPGPVLELGVGFYSTLLLHALCAIHNPQSAIGNPSCVLTSKT